jgi:hypothetical protein
MLAEEDTYKMRAFPQMGVAAARRRRGRQGRNPYTSHSVNRSQSRQSSNTISTDESEQSDADSQIGALASFSETTTGPSSARARPNNPLNSKTIE